MAPIHWPSARWRACCSCAHTCTYHEAAPRACRRHWRCCSTSRVAWSSPRPSGWAASLALPCWSGKARRAACCCSRRLRTGCRAWSGRWRRAARICRYVAWRSTAHLAGASQQLVGAAWFQFELGASGSVRVTGAQGLLAGVGGSVRAMLLGVRATRACRCWARVQFAPHPNSGVTRREGFDLVCEPRHTPWVLPRLSSMHVGSLQPLAAASDDDAMMIMMRMVLRRRWRSDDEDDEGDEGDGDDVFVDGDHGNDDALQGIVGAALQHARQPADTEEALQDAAWVAVTGFNTDALHEAAHQVLPANMHAQVRACRHACPNVRTWHGAGPSVAPVPLALCCPGSVG